jgi:hypothetical protein
MDLHLNDEPAELLVAELDRIIENDRYPFSPRIRTLRENPPPPPPAAPPKHYEPPSKGRYSRRR